MTLFKHCIQVKSPNIGETLVNSPVGWCLKLMSSISNLAPGYQQTAAWVTSRIVLHRPISIAMEKKGQSWSMYNPVLSMNMKWTRSTKGPQHIVSNVYNILIYRSSVTILLMVALPHWLLKQASTSNAWISDFFLTAHDYSCYKTSSVWYTKTYHHSLNPKSCKIRVKNHMFYCMTKLGHKKNSKSRPKSSKLFSSHYTGGFLCLFTSHVYFIQ